MLSRTFDVLASLISNMQCGGSVDISPYWYREGRERKGKEKHDKEKDLHLSFPRQSVGGDINAMGFLHAPGNL